MLPTEGSGKLPTSGAADSSEVAAASAYVPSFARPGTAGSQPAARGTFSAAAAASANWPQSAAAANPDVQARHRPASAAQQSQFAGVTWSGAGTEPGTPSGPGTPTAVRSAVDPLGILSSVRRLTSESPRHAQGRGVPDAGAGMPSSPLATPSRQGGMLASTLADLGISGDEDAPGEGGKPSISSGLAAPGAGAAGAVGTASITRPSSSGPVLATIERFTLSGSSAQGQQQRGSLSVPATAAPGATVAPPAPASAGSTAAASMEAVGAQPGLQQQQHSAVSAASLQELVSLRQEVEAHKLAAARLQAALEEATCR